MTNHVWQSTIFAAVAWVLALGLRRNRAAVRFWVWFAASVKFLVPFAGLMWMGTHLSWDPAARAVAAPAVTLAVGQIVEPFSDSVVVESAVTHRAVDWPGVALAVWACGVLGIVVVRLRAWRRVRRAVRASSRVEVLASGLEVRSSDGLMEPGVVGVWRPVLLMPEGIAERLTAEQLLGVLAHELAHVRRKDNFFAAIHMVVEAVFWFHPLVWWIGSRLVEERELACDEEVLRTVGEARVYADGILNVCKFYVESPLRCVAGVTGADLKKRIEAIMRNQMGLRLGFAKKIALAVAGMAALAAPIVVGVMNAPAVHAQTRAAATPKWEVTSVRSCKEFGQGERGATKNLSPGRMTLSCWVLQSLVVAAYLQFANSVEDRDPNLVLAPPVEGGPGWINSERYTIAAKAESEASAGVMQGPMLQALLEDRFKLKAHMETKEDQAAYALVVAKGGPKLKPFVEGSCTRRDNISAAPQPGDCLRRNTFKDGKIVIDEQGITVEEFAYIYLRRSPFNRIEGPVFDRTGLTGRYDIHLENALSTPPALRQAGADDDAASNGPSLFTALQEQLGLKLEQIKAPQKVLVIDHIERPSEN